MIDDLLKILPTDEKYENGLKQIFIDTASNLKTIKKVVINLNNDSQKLNH